MKAKVDQDTCIGCGLCTSVCPEVFSMNDEDKAQAIIEDIPADEESTAEDARDSCPVNAIDID